MVRDIRLSAPPLAVVALVTAASITPLPALGADKGPVSFQEEVKPILERRCVECHRPGGEGYEKSGLDLRSHEGLMQGTKYGPMVLPGRPFVSNLMVVLEGRADPKIQMPYHQKSLPDRYIDTIRQWIAEGAKNN